MNNTIGLLPDGLNNFHFNCALVDPSASGHLTYNESTWQSHPIPQYGYPSDRRSIAASVPPQTITPQSLQGKTVSVTLQHAHLLLTLSPKCNSHHVDGSQLPYVAVYFHFFFSTHTRELNKWNCICSQIKANTVKSEDSYVFEAGSRTFYDCYVAVESPGTLIRAFSTGIFVIYCFVLCFTLSACVYLYLYKCM